MARNYKIPIGLKVRHKGFVKAERSIGGAPLKFRQYSKEAVLKGARVIRAKQVKRAPKGKRQSIPPSIHVYVRPFRGGYRGISFTNYNVAFFTEEGTGMRGGWRSDRYPVPKDYQGPLNKMRSYRSKKTGEITWVGRHPGMKGRYWFKQGFEEGVPQAERAFQGAVRRAFV